VARIRTLEEVILSMLDFLRLAQPDANLNPGSVIRDTMVDLPATMIAQLYDELRSSAGFQAIISAGGTDLDKIARNYGLSRNTGTTSRGVAVLTTNTLDSNISIPVNSLFVARNGQRFRATSDTLIDAARPNLYRSNAVRLSSDLQLAGILDQFAVEVPVQAVAPGVAGRIGQFQLIGHNIPGISNVTNVVSFSNGSNIESDDAFRARILAVFRGANTGTESAYLSIVDADQRVISSSLIGPGNPLMTRDGTITSEDELDNLTIISSGTGGKADILVQGSDLQRNSESFIYNDRSGTQDPTSPTNDIVLGQRGASTELDMAQRRKEAIDSGIFPFQPVDSVLSLSGTASGPNFVPAFTDENGVERGNFKLVKDDGSFRGSAFGFDRISFISNQIDLPNEQISKPQLNSQDPLDFTDVRSISSVTQNVPVVREVAILDTVNRQFITVRHTPVFSVDRVTNITTGERYRIVSQNPDGAAGALNTTGRIQISGATLPRSTDTVEVSYSWALQYDGYTDYDNIVDSNRIRTASDSIDWGYANRIELEETESLYSVADGYHLLTSQPISKVINVYTYAEETVVRSGGKLVLSDDIISLLSVKDADGREVFDTAVGDGSVSGSTLTLPSDSLLLEGEPATVRYNNVDIYSPEDIDTGSFSGNKIVLADSIDPLTPLLVDYISSHLELLPTTSLSALPAFGVENEWSVGGSLTGAQPSAFVWTSGVRTDALRVAPTYLRLTLANTASSGRILLTGLAWRRIDAVFSSTNEGLQIDLSERIRAELGSLPAGVQLARVASLASVNIVNGVSRGTRFTYDLQNYELASAIWDRSAISNPTLNATSFALSSTAANADVEPISGTGLAVTFYITYPVTERITISSAGDQFTSEKYLFVDEVRVDSGFRNLSNLLTGTIAISAFTQPTTNSQYFANYSYTAPKEGERITVTYNYDRLMADLTLAIEPVRPIGGDILVRKKDSIPIWVEAEVTPLPTFTGSTSVLQSSIQQRISDFVNTQVGGSTIDASDIINAIYGIAGVDRVVLIQFNTEDAAGIKKSIVGKDDKFFATKSVVVSIVSR
jgi:uncharacterized phage protein gp47/JayE